MNISGGVEVQSRINSSMCARSISGISSIAGAENGVPPYLRTRPATLSRIRLSRMATVLSFIDGNQKSPVKRVIMRARCRGVNSPPEHWPFRGFDGFLCFFVDHPRSFAGRHESFGVPCWVVGLADRG